MTVPTQVIMDTLKWALDQYARGEATAEVTLVRFASVVYGQQAPSTDVTGGAVGAGGVQVAPVDLGAELGPEQAHSGGIQ